MPQGKDETARTAGPDGGDASENTGKTGTQDQQERDAQSQGEIDKDLALAWKGKAEELNRLMQKYGAKSPEELEQRLSQPPAATTDDEFDEDEDSEEAEDRGLEMLANRGDLAAKRALKLERKIARLERGIADAFVAEKVADPTLKARALAHYKKNRHRLGDYAAALAEVRVADLEVELNKTKAELSAMSKKPDPNVAKAPSTFGKEVTKTETPEPKNMRESEFDAEVVRLKAEGRFMDAMKLQRKYRLGEIELIPG